MNEGRGSSIKGRGFGQNFVLGRTVSDGRAQHPAAPPLQNFVALNICFARCASKNQAADVEPTVDQEPGGQQGDDRAVAMGDEPKLRVGS